MMKISEELYKHAQAAGAAGPGAGAEPGPGAGAGPAGGQQFYGNQAGGGPSPNAGNGDQKKKDADFEVVNWADSRLPCFAKAHRGGERNADCGF